MDSRRLGSILVCGALLGCASKPVTAPRAVVPEAAPSELRAAATAGKRFGHMVAVGIGAAVGAVGGFYASKTETEQEIIDQLGGLYLGEKTARPGIPVSGFVFFPEGSYVGVRLVAVEKPGGAATDVFGRMVKPETD